MYNDPIIGAVPILQEFEGVSDNDIQRALKTRQVSSGKQGICIVVNEPDRDASKDAPGPIYTTNITILVLESPQLNRAAGGFAPQGNGLTLRSVSLRVEQLLQHFLRGSTSSWVERSSITNDGNGTIGRQINIGIVIQTLPVAKVVAPAISVDSNSKTVLTTTTSGSSIYYTLDGSFPGKSPATDTLNRPVVSTAVKYTAPFVVPAGSFLRVAAYSNQLAPSNIVEQQY